MVVPAIDITSAVSGRRPPGAERERLAAAVDGACRDVGFFAVTGHGVPAEVVDELIAEAWRFFELPTSDRMSAAKPAPGAPYGDDPIAAEALNRSIGGDTPPDLKETFNVGPVGPPPRPLAEMDDPDERDVYAPNQWPDSLPTLRPAVEAYANWDARVECIVATGEEPRYRPVTAGSHLMSKFRSTVVRVARPFGVSPGARQSWNVAARLGHPCSDTDRYPAVGAPWAPWPMSSHSLPN